MEAQETEEWRVAATERLRAAGVALREEERPRLEIADFGLDAFAREGLALLVYVNNERYCAKELVLFPNQTCPEHRHPPIGELPGKQETFRVRQGTVRLFVEGAPNGPSRVQPPKTSAHAYTVFHEIALGPGDQHTIPPDTKHWFQAGDEGAVVSEFSSPSRDEYDVFTDARIRR